MPALKVAFLLNGEDTMSEVESIVRDLRLWIVIKAWGQATYDGLIGMINFYFIILPLEDLHSSLLFNRRPTFI